jgi:hypothetical protein
VIDSKILLLRNQLLISSIYSFKWDCIADQHIIEEIEWLIDCLICQAAHDVVRRLWIARRTSNCADLLEVSRCSSIVVK